MIRTVRVLFYLKKSWTWRKIRSKTDVPEHKSISQRGDTGQLNVPPQQGPITLSLTRVTLNQTLDKLAHNASSQSELWEARHAIPEFTKLDKLSQSSMGEGTLDIREAPQASRENQQRRVREDS